MTTPERAAQQREYYLNNRDTVRQTSRNRYLKHRQAILEKSYAHVRENREWLQGIKAACGCVDCGINDPDVLEFDHRDPSQKSFTIGSSSGVGGTRERLLDEINKCDVRCANCHRKRTVLLKHARIRKPKQEKIGHA